MNSLSEDYDGCIVGRTVAPIERLVYSLSGLLHAHDGNHEEVREVMRAAVEAHGVEAPLFVDDTLNEGGQDAPVAPDEPTPVIITEPRPKVMLPFPGTKAPSIKI